MLLFDTETTPSPRYETLARIGRGGMAEVLLTATRGNGVVKLTVLKCLWPELAEDPDFVEMFLDEARLCARLAHPNVVQTHDVVQHEGRLALAMEYLEGQPLNAVLGRLRGAPPLTLPTRLRIITGVLAGLEYAHTLTDFDGAPLEVVHRDVSPQNVIVTYDGNVKLIDFGVAKTLAASHQTRPGGIKGKLAYLAPEAIRGGRVDRRADVFSAGVMLWEILAGRRLWGRKTEGVSGAWRLAGGEPAPALPAELDLPRALRVITTRALALDPAARFQTAAELGAALEHVGIDASDSHARRLGGLVSDAFAAERAQRRALVEFHLRPAAAGAHGATVDYEAFELSRPEPAPATEERDDTRALELEETSVQRRSTAPERARGVRRPIRSTLAAAAIATVALASGVYLGRGAFSWPVRPSTSLPASPLANAPRPHVEAPPATAVEASATNVDPPAETREPHAALTHEHREHRAHRHPLDLVSDDVLGLDGELASSAAAGSKRSLHD
jgi:eukaryotic-like serine/threonine-protein kinase